MGNTMLKVTLAMTMLSCALATSAEREALGLKEAELEVPIITDLAQNVSVFGAVGALTAYGGGMGFLQALETVSVFALLGFIVFAIRRWCCDCGPGLIREGADMV